MGPLDRSWTCPEFWAGVERELADVSPPEIAAYLAPDPGTPEPAPGLEAEILRRLRTELAPLQAC